MFNVGSIFVKGHMQVMWISYIAMLLVTLLIVVSSYQVYILKYVSHVHEVIGIGDMYHLRGTFVAGSYMVIA